MPKTIPSKAAAPKKTLSAAERQAAADERGRRKAEHKRQKDLEEMKRRDAFEAGKELIWLRLWSRALQMFILIQEESLIEAGSGAYWFQTLQVGAVPGQEFIEHDALSERVTPAALSIDNVEQLTYTVDSLVNARISELQRREDVRTEADRVARVRRSALEKLSPEEREVLNLG